MTNHFDKAGSLWVGVDASTIPETFPEGMLGNVLFSESTVLGMGIGVRELNLTAYIRSLTKPDWVNAALTSTSANISVEQKL